MSNSPGAVELLARPSEDRTTHRVFVMSGRVRLGDVDRRGRLRLDATARLLQDAATDDATDALLDRSYGWLVRRTMIVTVHPAILGEAVEVATWCTGIGRSWAERRSQITGERGARIDAVSLWVQIDVVTGRPARIGTDFLDAYEATAGTRSVSARLSLGAPDDAFSVEPVDWAIRRTDVDPFGHVNNAATWAFLEEFAELDRAGERTGRAEMEYLQPVEYGRVTKVLATHRRGDGRRVDSVSGDLHQSDGLHDHQAGCDAWLLQDGVVRVAACWTPTPEPSSTPESSSAQDDSNGGISK
jgi:acyl-ACP thioesterase